MLRIGAVWRYAAGLLTQEVPAGSVAAPSGPVVYSFTATNPGTYIYNSGTAQNLQIENQAMLHLDSNLLTAVDHGDRLDEMRARVKDTTSTGKCVIDVYKFDSVNVTLIVPFGVQSGLSLGFNARGSVTHETYDSASKLISTQSSQFANTFAIRRATGARWLNVAVLPPGTGS